MHSLFTFNFKECPANLPLFKIRGTTNCNIKNTCTAVSCCVEVGKVGRTFEFMMDIDFCNQKFTVGIEKLVEEVSLNMFEYGKSWVFLRFFFENESLYQNIENYIKVFCMNFMDKFKDISYPLFIISTFILFSTIQRKKMHVNWIKNAIIFLTRSKKGNCHHGSD